METSSDRHWIFSRIYNHNPFYVISAVLMLYSMRSSYGELTVGEINCWLMMGILAAYTSVLAAVSVLIVRWGQVWEDARSLVLVILLLFLAVSVSADDLFANMESAAGGKLLMLSGYLFSAIVTELVLRGTGLRMGMWYRVPLHLLLLLFFVAPWWCSPEQHQRSATALQWTIFAFPAAASVLLLGLLPAIRKGKDYANENGSPWRWPLYPWAAFGFIAIAVALRSFALAMTFGPTGPIWIEQMSGGRSISFDVIWGPYFLIPLVLAILILVLEAGFVTGNANTVRGALKTAPVLLALAVPLSNGAVFQGFLHQFTVTVGPPLWLTTWILIAFYSWAWGRRAVGADIGVLCSISLLSVIGPHSVDFDTLTPLQPWPLFVVGAAVLGRGLWRQSTRMAMSGVTIITLATAVTLPATWPMEWRTGICFHLLWGAMVVLGFAFRDEEAGILRAFGAILMPVAALVVLTHPAAAVLPVAGVAGYLTFLTVTCLVIAKVWRNLWYWYGFLSLLACGGYEIAAFLFQFLVETVGQRALTASAWSIASLLIAFLISAHKAKWLPPRLFPGWPAATPPTDELTDPLAREHSNRSSSTPSSHAHAADAT